MQPERRHAILVKLAASLARVSEAAGAPYRYLRDQSMHAAGAPFRGAVSAAESLLLGKLHTSGAAAGTRRRVVARAMSLREAEAVRAGTRRGRVGSAVRDKNGNITGYNGAIDDPGGVMGAISRNPGKTALVGYALSGAPGSGLVKDFAMMPVDIATAPVRQVAAPLLRPGESMSPAVLRALQSPTSMQNPMEELRANARMPHAWRVRRGVPNEPALQPPPAAS